MKIGLRICVNTLHGLQEGVPNLLRLLDSYQVQATFFLAVGPDRSGRLFHSSSRLTPQRSLGFCKRFVRALSPVPSLAKKSSGLMRSVAENGHEVGLLAYDPVTWIEKAAFADVEWTKQQILQGIELYEDVFHEAPKAIAAPGWQINSSVLAAEQSHGFDYASDVLGKSAFFPELQGIESSCLQIPTTLPLLCDLLRSKGEVTPENAHEYIYAESQYMVPNGHLYSMDAETEGLNYLQLLEKLLVMWKGYGEGVVSLRSIYESLDKSSLAKHRIGWSNEDDPEQYVAKQSVIL